MTGAMVELLCAQGLVALVVTRDSPNAEEERNGDDNGASETRQIQA
jgi:hypothetical protein